MANTMIITNAGLAEIAGLSGSDKVVLETVGFGTGKYTAAADRTALDAQFKTLPITGGGASDDKTMHLTLKDASSDAYQVYEVGVYSSTGVLFAVYSSTTAIIDKASTAQALLAIDFVLTNVNPSQITVGDISFELAGATTETEGVVELATSSEVIAGTDEYRVVTPKTLAALTATDSRRGLTEYATQAETIAGTSGQLAVTPYGLRAVVPASVGASETSNATPVYVVGGVVKAVTATAGSATQPVYMESGNIRACTYSLNKTVPADAVFTDTVTTVTVDGTGNAITSASVSGSSVTLTKGISFVPSTGGTYIGTVNVPLPVVSTDSNQIASTAYVKDCVPVSVGSSTNPVYTNASGVLTASSETVGGLSNPVYMNGGNITACNINSSSSAGVATVTEQEISTNGAGYVVFGSGFKIQWGTISIKGSGSHTISFSKSFSKTPSVTIAIGSWTDDPACVSSVGTSSFTVTTYGDTNYSFNLKWIAVGA